MRRIILTIVILLSLLYTLVFPSPSDDYQTTVRKKTVVHTLLLEKSHSEDLTAGNQILRFNKSLARLLISNERGDKG
ncbi:hypothetical protein LA10_06769 [Thermotoga neapolitana LA10]|nr:hypothetical protein CELL2_07625 [Thermotoga sp. Cell2]KFZ21488.1 hypothetical protein LA10_06769 [Thermotoga neapolitana LA10]KHC92944.1 hypothetical protein TBGT1765_02887 [Thermotoga sp. TBGT1765]KHC94352.1 hypothetical protein TBGT1766_02564 [Thermotoga sp. TBGT1766]KHC95708.1 hypothetical protein XYL54_07436 [Thermotoga sp. Xyl54]